MRPGTSSRVLARLDRLASRARRARSSDLLLATVPSAALAALGADPDVTNVSSNAAVRSLGADLLSENALLDTEGLLATRSSGQTVRGVPYTGRGIGVALIDSGIVNSGDLNNILFFDFTHGGQPGLPVDDYGHGTHVAGLIASSGRLSRARTRRRAQACTRRR